MNALLHSGNSIRFSAGHDVFQSFSVEVLQNKDITCIFLCKWSNIFWLEKVCSGQERVITAICNHQL